MSVSLGFFSAVSAQRFRSNISKL